MKIAIAQIQSIPNELKTNLLKMKNFAKEAAINNCEIVIFPEIADFGYDTDIIREVSPSIDINILCDIAKEEKIIVITGTLRKVNNKLYNSQIVIDKNGQLLSVYDKIHLIDRAPYFEKSIYTAGTTVKTFSINEYIFGQSICYDLRFPELYQLLRKLNSSILICSACWPKTRVKDKIILSQARAIENQAYFLVSASSGLNTSGNSLIISPRGEIISQAGESEELIMAEINIEEVINLRNEFKIFDDKVL